MKTIAKTLLAIILLMVSISSYTFSGNGSASIGTGTITYRVTVHITDDIPMIGNYYYVAMTDDQGRLVAPVQMYNSGKITLNDAMSFSSNIQELNEMLTRGKTPVMA